MAYLSVRLHQPLPLLLGHHRLRQHKYEGRGDGPGEQLEACSIWGSHNQVVLNGVTTLQSPPCPPAGPQCSQSPPACLKYVPRPPAPPFPVPVEALKLLPLYILTSHPSRHVIPPHVHTLYHPCSHLFLSLQGH